MSGTRLWFLFLGGAGLLFNVVAILRQSADLWTLRTLESVLWPAALLYVGIRFDSMVATAPQRVIRLVWLGIAITGWNALVSFKWLASQLRSAPLETAVFGLLQVGSFALVLLIWRGLLIGVRKHASVADGLRSREPSGAAGGSS